MLLNLQKGLQFIELSMVNVTNAVLYIVVLQLDTLPGLFLCVWSYVQQNMESP